MVDKNKSVIVQGIEIHISTRNEEDYISLTDMVKVSSEGELLIKSWLRNKQTVDFLGAWEKVNNANFNLVEFDLIRMNAGSNLFVLSVKQWREKVNGIGLVAKTGRYGRTFAHH
jgi:hypothetical protein